MCMEMDWVRLGRELAQAREHRGERQTDVIRALGIGRSTLQKIESGHPYSKVQPAHHMYARHVGWSESSVSDVLAGGDPSPTAVPSTEVGAGDPLSEMPLAVRQALSEGELIDTRTLTVPVGDGHLTATIVVRGDPEGSEEDLREQLLAWRRRAAQLDHLAAEPD